MPQWRTSDFVVEELRQAIRLRAFAPSDRLPPERELAVRLGVSVATLRVALRGLEAEGYVAMRRGRGGGAFVNYVGALEAPFGLERLRTGRREIEEALLTRSILEPAVAEHVAALRPDGLTQALAPLVEEMDAAQDDEEFQRLDIQFHRTLADAVGSSWISEMTDRIRSAMTPGLDALPAGQSWYRQSNQGHRAIVDAVGRGDPDLAAKAARTHSEGTERAVKLLLNPVPAVDGTPRSTRRGR